MEQSNTSRYEKHTLLKKKATCLKNLGMHAVVLTIKTNNEGVNWINLYSLQWSSYGNIGVCLMLTPLR